MNIVDFPSCRNEAYVNSAKEFLELIENGEISHAVICYRKADGDLNYRLFNEEHLTYLIGMMARVSFNLQAEIK